MKLRILIALLWAMAASAWAPAQASVVTDWNLRILICVQGQTAPVAIPANRAGPPGLLDTAVAHAAVHDAVQAHQGRFEPYHYDNSALRGVGSPEAAAAAAAYGVLVGLYGADDPCLVGVENPAVTYAGDPGLQAGTEAAAALVPLYRPPFPVPPENGFPCTSSCYVGGTDPGEWRPTPPLSAAGAFRFLTVTAPFVLNRPSQFRPPRQPPLSSMAYVRDYNEVKALGSLSNSARTLEQTDLANFWLTNPFHTWHATVRTIANAHVADIGDQARLFALVALANADAAISCWETKYRYNFWRPETAIREGNNDGNAFTVGDPGWLPYIVSPPYPDHSSGANNLAASTTGTLANFFGTDEFEFSITSSIAGLTLNPRPYDRFSDASLDVVEVRILQGIHFRFADEQARRQGLRVAKWVFMKSLRPVAD